MHHLTEIEIPKLRKTRRQSGGEENSSITRKQDFVIKNKCESYNECIQY